MQQETEKYLASRSYFFEEAVDWPNDISLTVCGYLTSELPPEESIIAIRAVVFRADNGFCRKYSMKCLNCLHEYIEALQMASVST